MDIDEKIELFFFDPAKDREEYIKFYRQVNSERFTSERQRYRYSPLYLLLKDIRYCYGLGREFNPIRNRLNSAEFAGVILLRIGFTNTVKKIFSGNFEKFAKDYMDIDNPDHLEALNLLRNALEHSYYSLYTYKKIPNSDEKIKVYFSLGYYEWIVKKADNWQRPYPSEMYLINPKRLYTAFERGLRKFKEDIKNPENTSLRAGFERYFDIDQWVAMG